MGVTAEAGEIALVATPVRWDLCMTAMSDLGVTGLLEMLGVDARHDHIKFSQQLVVSLPWTRPTRDTPATTGLMDHMSHRSH